MPIEVKFEAREGKWLALTRWGPEFGEPFENRLVLSTGVPIDDYPELDKGQANWQTVNGTECIVCYRDGRYQYFPIGEKAVERRPIPRPRRRPDGHAWVWRDARWKVDW